MKKGFTLVEAAIATAIFALAMAGFIGAFMSSQYSAALAAGRMKHLQDARTVMENLLADTYGSLHVGTKTLPGGTTYTVSENTNFPNSVKDITVTVAWTNPGASVPSSLSLHGSMSYQLHQP